MAVAELYRGRWPIEGLFLRLTTVLRCEVNALGYPPAALFGFCVALAAGNAYAAVKGALRAAHGPAVADGVSDYHLALEVSGACPGLWIAIPVETWAEIGGRSAGQMAEWLKGPARGANLGRYRKATRGPKKPKPPRTRFSDVKHIATSRLLKGEQTRCAERDGNMAFTTPSVRAATFAEITPAACPAAGRLAALIVDATRTGGTDAGADPADSTATEPEVATPRQVSRFASSALALARPLATVPSGQPSCRATSLRV